MINCSKCSQVLVEPIKKLENSVFCIKLYECKKCNSTSKEAYYQ